MTKSWTDIASLIEGYRTGKYKPSEVVGYYLERIKKYNPKLNAFLTVTEKEALARAQELDSKTDGIGSHPLFGVPVAFKDLFQTAGVKTTA
mgnify:FL=1